MMLSNFSFSPSMPGSHAVTDDDDDKGHDLHMLDPLHPRFSTPGHLNFTFPSEQPPFFLPLIVLASPSSITASNSRTPPAPITPPPCSSSPITAPPPSTPPISPPAQRPSSRIPAFPTRSSADGSDTVLSPLVTLVSGTDVPDVRLEGIAPGADAHFGEPGYCVLCFWEVCWRGKG